MSLIAFTSAKTKYVHLNGDEREMAKYTATFAISIFFAQSDARNENWID